MFSSKSLMVSGLTFRPLIHFEFILCMVLGSVLIWFFWMWQFSFPNTTVWRDCVFCRVCSFLFCCKLIFHIWLGLFLGSQFCSIDPYVCFCANIMLFWLLKLCSIVWSQRSWFLQLCFSFSSLFWLLGVFSVSIEILRYFKSSSVENVIGHLIGDRKSVV